MNKEKFYKICQKSINHILLMIRPHDLRYRLRLEPPFIQAILKEDISVFLKEVRSGTDINQRGLYGKTPLAVLAEMSPNKKTIWMFKKLLSLQANLEKRDNIGETPLISSCRCNHCEWTALLIRHGSNVHILDKGNASALSYAVFNQNEINVDFLLNADAHPSTGNLGLISPYEMSRTLKNKRITGKLHQCLYQRALINPKSSFSKERIPKTVKISALLYQYDEKIKAGIMIGGSILIGLAAFYSIMQEKNKKNNLIQRPESVLRTKLLSKQNQKS